jgi:hypothetical protein
MDESHSQIHFHASLFISVLLDSEELLVILSMHSSLQKAIEEMGEPGVFPCLLSIIRESICGYNKESLHVLQPSKPFVIICVVIFNYLSVCSHFV